MATKKPKITIKGMSSTPGYTKITGTPKTPSIGTSGGKGSLKVTRVKPTVKFYPETKQSMEKMKDASPRNKVGKATPSKSMIAPGRPNKPANKVTLLPKRITRKTMNGR